MLTGENGILTQAQRAKNETENKQKEEESTLANYESYLNSYSGKNTEFTDSLGNKIIIPAGFKVVNPGDNVEDGIIIEDVTHEATAGSQFVWIPVGEDIKKKDKTTFNIKLSRYTFAEDGTPTDQENKIIENYFQELNKGKGNTTAKENIESETEGFRESAIKNGGYYIGRYEARTLAPRTASTEDSGLTQITVKPNDYVYNYVTQKQAAERSQGMYSDTNFTSDLMNSYAWDTAIDFLQKCDDREGDNLKPYSRQTTLNSSLASKGTNNETTQDVICNVYDMASNCYEWTTETSNNASYPCVLRGGYYGVSNRYVANRGNNREDTGGYSYAFRPLLYVK